MQIAQHQNAAPLRDGHADGQLTDAQGNGLVVSGNGVFDPVKGFFSGVVLFQLPVTGGENDLVFLKYRVPFQQLCQSLGAVDSVQQPKRVAQLLPQFRGGVGVFFVCGQGVEKFYDFRLMDKSAAFVGGKEFVQIKGVVHAAILAGQIQTLLYLIVDHVGELIGEHGQPGQGSIGIVVVPVPAFLSGLLVRVGPVVNLRLGELFACQGLEGRAGEVKGVLPADAPKSPFCTHGVHALLGFVYNQQIEVQIPDPFELVVFTAEVYGTLQPLQGFEGHHAEFGFARHDGFQIFLPAQNARFALQRVRFGDKGKFTTPADEFLKIFRPGVGNAGPVGHDQHFCKAHLPDEIIGGQRFSKPGLGVPEKFRAAALKIVPGHVYGILLLLPQIVGAFFRAFGHSTGSKGVKVPQQPIPVRVEPLRTRFPRNIPGFQVVVKIVVGEVLAGAVLEHGIVLPGQFPADIRRVGLLLDARVDALPLGVAYLRPAVVVGDARGIVGVDHGDNALEALDLHGHVMPSPLHGFQ